MVAIIIAIKWKHSIIVKKVITRMMNGVFTKIGYLNKKPQMHKKSENTKQKHTENKIQLNQYANELTPNSYKPYLSFFSFSPSSSVIIYKNEIIIGIKNQKLPLEEETSKLE
jgi:hypothetical protein